eukprot:201858-Prymnesium_polylepis.1
MIRTLRRDLSRYNAEEKEELQEESGWKLVHADVLRPPPLPLLLCATVGTGMQLFGMGCIAIVCAMAGFLSPANRGGLLTATLLLFVLMGVPAGYFASSWCGRRAACGRCRRQPAASANQLRPAARPRAAGPSLPPPKHRSREAPTRPLGPAARPVSHTASPGTRAAT